MLTSVLQAVRGNGVDPVWVTGDLPQGDKGSIYVLDNFDTALYKTLAGNCRSVIKGGGREESMTNTANSGRRGGTATKKEEGRGGEGRGEGEVLLCAISTMCRSAITKESVLSLLVTIGTEQVR